MKKSTLIAEFDQVVHTIDSSFPSLYTKDDVIKVLRNLEGVLKDFINDKEETYESIINITPEQYDTLIDNIADEVDNNISAGHCIDEYDFSLAYNEIQVDSISVNNDNLRDVIEQVVNRWVVDIKNDDDCGC